MRSMASRYNVCSLLRHVSPPAKSRATNTATHYAFWQRPQRSMASVVTPPVTQDATSSRGPTAMVFMNMGGPSTTAEVGTFLSRLFVWTFLNPIRHSSTFLVLIKSTGRWRSDSTWSPTGLPWPSYFPSPNAQDSETICRHWWWISYTQMVGISIRRNVQNIGCGVT